MGESWDPAAFNSTADTGGGEDEAPQVREPKVNKKRLEELEPSGKKLTVYTRDPKNKSMVKCDALSYVPSDVAAICSNYIYKQMQKDSNFYLVMKDDLGLDAWKFVFDWMKQCGDEKTVANMPEIKDLIKEGDPDDETVGFTPFIRAMLVAQKLDIPKASFGKFMIRKLQPLAKDYLMPLDLMARAYDDGDEVFADLELREIAVKSIFEAWYSYKMEKEENWDYMCDLAEMRDNIPALDHDLSEAITAKDQFLKDARRRRADKAAEEAAEAAAGAGDDNDGGDAGEVGGDDDWAKQGAAASGTDDWANAGAGAAVQDWEKDAGAGTGGAAGNWDGGDAGGCGGGGSGNWADDMNDSGFTPVPAPAAGGGW